MLWWPAGLWSERGGVDVEAAMVSWREELARRETAATEQVEGLRQQIVELTEQLEVAEQLLSRLAITRETMAEILTDAEEPAPVPNSRSPIGATLVRNGCPGWIRQQRCRRITARSWRCWPKPNTVCGQGRSRPSSESRRSTGRRWKGCGRS